MPNNMKRVIVIGCAGSGKSVFSRSFAQKTGLPLYHLDNIWWREDGTNVTSEQFDEELSSILCRDEWIIDGNYQRTMEWRMQECDTVIFFDIPTRDCIDGIKSRKGTARPDMPWKNAPEDDDEQFMEYIRRYNEDNKPLVLELIEKYEGKDVVIFKSRLDADKYINNMK